MTIKPIHQITTSLAQQLNAFNKLLARPVDASTVATFRFLFGLMMIWEVGNYFSHDYIGRYYVQPSFYFTYELFPLATPLPETGMYLLFLAMGLFALGIMLGAFYKIATLLFLLAYTYVFLLDKTPYNNHYYLIILISFLLLFVDGHRWVAIDQLHKAKLRLERVPFWHLFLLRTQIFVVYFYGGIAKLNKDWLIGEPMRMWLANRADYPLLGPFFTTEWAGYFFSYGGLFFDLSIGFLLLWKPTRRLAFVGALFFHLMNDWLFSIGIFPYLAMAATVLFVEPDGPRRLFQRFCGHLVRPWPQQVGLTQTGQVSLLGPWTFGFVIVYLALQLLIPLRHWLYPGDVSWTEEGHRFSWHMKLRDKAAEVDLYIHDPHTGQARPVGLSADLTERQISKMATRPDMILQYAHYLANRLAKTGQDNVIITADAWVSLNGRPTQRLIDPHVNLAQVRAYPFWAADWILPLEENISPRTTSVLYWLSVVTGIMANLGLAMSIYSAFAYARTLRLDFVRLSNGRSNQGPISMVSSPGYGTGLLKAILMTLPYGLILLALAAWTTWQHPIYLGVALCAALLAGASSFQVAPFLTWPADRPPRFFWLPSFISITNGLLLLLILIIAT